MEQNATFSVFMEMQIQTTKNRACVIKVGRETRATLQYAHQTDMMAAEMAFAANLTFVLAILGGLAVIVPLT